MMDPCLGRKKKKDEEGVERTRNTWMMPDGYHAQEWSGKVAVQVLVHPTSWLG